MRRLVAAFIAAALALSLVILLTGCGGGGGSATTSSSAPAESAAAPPPVPAAGTAAAINRSENATTVFTPFPTGDFVPAELKAKIDAKRPTIIYFYDSRQKVSEANRTIIDEVREDNRGAIDLVTYDIGKYVVTSDTGEMTIKPEFAADKTAQQSVQLARALGVSFTPFIVVTDGQGYVIWQHRGLVDQAFLDREVTRAAQ